MPGTGTTERVKRRRHGVPNFKLVWYAGDWSLMVSGSRADAQALREEISGILSQWACACRTRRP